MYDLNCRTDATNCANIKTFLFFCFIEDVCGQSNFSVSLPVLFNRHISNNRIIDCLWYVTSPNETYIYLDVVDIGLWNSHSLSFGMVTDGSLEEGVTLQSTQPNGTSYFFSGNIVWIAFSSFVVFSDGAASLDFILRSEPLEGKNPSPSLS